MPGAGHQPAERAAAGLQGGLRGPTAVQTHHHVAAVHGAGQRHIHQTQVLGRVFQRQAGLDGLGLGLVQRAEVQHRLAVGVVVVESVTTGAGT